MSKPVPSVGSQNWGAVLNAHLAQLQDPATGTIRFVDSTDPTGVPAGYTVVNVAQRQLKYWDGAKWVVLLQSPEASNNVNRRIQLTGNYDMYVSLNGNDTNGDGTSAKPFRTIQKAVDYAYTTFDFYRYIVTINVAAGEYKDGNLAITGVPVNGGPFHFVIKGAGANTSTGTRLVLEDFGTLVSAQDGAGVTLQDMVFQYAGATTASNNVFPTLVGVTNNAKITISNVRFGNMPSSTTIRSRHMLAFGSGYVRISGNYSAGNAYTHIASSSSEYSGRFVSADAIDATFDNGNGAANFVTFLNVGTGSIHYNIGGSIRTAGTINATNAFEIAGGNLTGASTLPGTKPAVTSLTNYGNIF